MQDINFISGSGGSKRSKGKKQSRDIQYTTGEVLDATQKMNRVEAKKEEKAEKKPKKKAKKKSFFEWRTERELTAQEKAEAAEKAERERREKAEKKNKKEQEKRLEKERERFQEEMKEAKKRSQKRGKQTRQAPTPKKPTLGPVPEPPKKQKKVHAAPEEHHEETPDLLHAQEPAEREVHKARMHVAGDTMHKTPASNLLEGSVYSMPAPTGPKAEKTDKKTRSRKGSAKIHVPPAIASHKQRRKWFTLTRQEMDTSALDVNLIPDEILDQLRARNYLRELVYVALAGIMVVLIIFAALNIYQRKIATDTATLETQIQEFDREIAGYIALQTEISSLSQRLQSLQNVLEGHVYWSPFLQRLEELTLSNVYYTSMAGSSNTGQFTFNAVARSYQDVDAQARVLRQSPDVLSVDITSVAATQSTAAEAEEEEQDTVEEETVSFVLAVQFNPTLFDFDSNELLIEGN